MIYMPEIYSLQNQFLKALSPDFVSHLRVQKWVEPLNFWLIVVRDSNDFDALIIIMQGLKRKRRCEDDCKDHLFSLKCIKPNPKYDISLFFCPKYQRDPQPPEFIHPEFNNDGKYYTSAFILGIDRRLLLKNEQQEIMDHQKQLRDSLEKRNQLVFPRPNSKHTLCSVCKEHYRNYYIHIAAEEHRQKIGASAYNQHIKELCSSYQHLWEGAEERADEEAERRQAEYEEERRRRQAEMVHEEDEEGEEEEEESLQDVQRGDMEDMDQAEDEEEPEEYQIKQKKPSTRHLNRNDDTLPLSRACKRSAPTEYLRNKYKAALTAERIHKEKAERRYERERDKIKIQRDTNPNREFVKAIEQQGDTFIIMKAIFNAPNPQPLQSQPQPQPQPQPQSHLQNQLQQTQQPQPQNQQQTQQEPEFVWRKSQKLQRMDQQKTQKFDKSQRTLYWLPEKVERMEKFDNPTDKNEMMDPEGSPERIQRQNRKYQIVYDEYQFNKDSFNEDQYDMRYPYYPYPPPPLLYPPPPLSSFKQEAIKSEYLFPNIKPEGTEKTDKQAFRHDGKGIQGGKLQGKAQYSYKNYYERGHSPYYSHYMYPTYDSYSREKGEEYYYYKEKEKTVAHDKKNHYEYPETPYQWPYPPPPPPYYMPPEQPQNYHPTKPANSSMGLQGNTNINISFPMYMCPPSHPTYPPTSRYSPPPPPHMISPYMGYPYPPYMPNQTRDNILPLPQSQNSTYSSHGYPQHPHPPLHQYEMKGSMQYDMKTGHSGFQGQQNHPPPPSQQSHQYPHSQSKNTANC